MGSGHGFLFATSSRERPLVGQLLSQKGLSQANTAGGWGEAGWKEREEGGQGLCCHPQHTARAPGEAPSEAQTGFLEGQCLTSP